MKIKKGGIHHEYKNDVTIWDYGYWYACLEGGGWIKCGLGVVGGALTGGVAGGAVGTVTLPFFGTVSGAAAGFWGGGATGAATFC